MNPGVVSAHDASHEHKSRPPKFNSTYHTSHQHRSLVVKCYQCPLMIMRYEQMIDKRGRASVWALARRFVRSRHRNPTHYPSDPIPSPAVPQSASATLGGSVCPQCAASRCLHLSHSPF
ncbi:hypothetical protein J6590_010615 [Homalodisca vitripennis]|nr:hypothetical protein J6590_010615 [Homalodisca vitripennis]